MVDPHPTSSLSATRRSMSVTRAARTRYSTPTGPTSQGSATQALDRGSSEAKPGPAIPSSAVGDGSLTTRRRVRPTGIAFRSPSGNIRHRFGGHLRAARRRDLHRRHSHRTSRSVIAAREGARRSRRRRTRDGRDLDPDRGRWIRPVIWRRHCMKLSKVGALAAVSVLAFAACSTAAAAAAPSAGGSAAAGGANHRQLCAEQDGHEHERDPRLLEPAASRVQHGADQHPIVKQIKQTLDGQKIGNFTIKYTDLDDASAAKNGDWDGAVEQRTPTRPPLTPTRWSTSAPTTRALRSCRSRS